VPAPGDDSFSALEAERVFTVEGEEIVAGPGTFVLVPPGLRHDFSNRTDETARFANIHAPAGFDLRLES
jgi:mannose-6-phosphate isomerase-like protein (cupin superfamily)